MQKVKADNNSKYKPGEFGYIWVVEEGKEDIEGTDYKGNINYSENGMTSLKGAPRTITGEFNCSFNKLTSLEYAPVKVGKGFYCSDNKLTSLKGCPKEVGDTLYCANNKLTSLKGCAEKAYSIDISNNKLTSLEGCPKVIRGYFSCKGNKLSNLKYGPEKVGGLFDCSNNQLTSLEGCPKMIGGNFNCGKNIKLKSLEGIGKVKGKIIPESMAGEMAVSKKVIEYTLYDEEEQQEYPDIVTFTALKNGKVEIDSRGMDQVWSVDGNISKAIKEYEGYQKYSGLSIINKKEKISSSVKKFGVLGRLRISTNTKVTSSK